jgi:hypothetical protein
MANLVTAEANRLLDASFGTAAYVAPSGPMKLALATSASTAAAAGTEVTGNGYGRQTIAFVAASGGANSNFGAETFTNMPAATTTYLDIYDNAARRCWFGQLAAPKTTASGDTLSFANGAITVTLG